MLVRRAACSLVNAGPHATLTGPHCQGHTDRATLTGPHSQALQLAVVSIGDGANFSRPPLPETVAQLQQVQNDFARPPYMKLHPERSHL